MRFTLLNVKFEINYIFLCLIVSYLFIDKTGLCLPLLISVIVHETAHLLFLILFKCKIMSVKLNVGAVLVLHSDDISKGHKIASILAGPVSNLLLSAVAYILKNEIYFAINLILAVYNLLPLSGVDGGALLKTALDGFCSNKTIDRTIVLCTVLICTVFVAIYFTFKKLFNNYSLLLLCLYILTPILLKKILKES